jgi:hypothetical protein
MDSMVQAGKYLYIEDLQTLAGRVPSPIANILPPSSWYTINTPLKIDEWRQQLKGHPDPDFVEYLLQGMTEGFHIGFRYQECTCRSAKRNMKSALDNPQVSAAIPRS